MSFSARDFIAGWGAGVCGLLVGHPADTIKVRQQVSEDPRVLRIFIKTIKNEGVQGLYKGILIPLLFAGIQNSIFFGVYGNVLRTFQSSQGEDTKRRTCSEGPQHNRYWHENVYCSGFIAAFVHSFLGCPVDLIKIKLQIQSNSQKLGKHRVFDCMRDIYRNSGYRGFYHGLVATFCRDVPISGFYVLLYEHLLSLGKSPTDRCAEYSVGNQLLAGGLSGTFTWIAVSPLDVVKSRIQADDIKNPKYKGLIDCFIKSYKEDGIKVFARGFSIHIIRGFPVNAATFVGYEWFYKHLTIFDE